MLSRPPLVCWCSPGHACVAACRRSATHRSTARLRDAVEATEDTFTRRPRSASRLLRRCASRKRATTTASEMGAVVIRTPRHRGRVTLQIARTRADRACDRALCTLRVCFRGRVRCGRHPAGERAGRCGDRADAAAQSMPRSKAMLQLDLDRFRRCSRRGYGFRVPSSATMPRARLDAAKARQRAAQDRVRSSSGNAEPRHQAGTRPRRVPGRSGARRCRGRADRPVLEKSLRDANVPSPHLGHRHAKLASMPGEIVARGARRSSSIRRRLDPAWANLLLFRARADGAAHLDPDEPRPCSPTLAGRGSTAGGVHLPARRVHATQRPDGRGAIEARYAESG